LNRTDDLGDQFLALQKDRTQAADDGRHLDSWSMTRTPSAALAAVGVNPLPGQFFDFLDPWGNLIDVNAL
jgi:hypothetical protein